MSTSLVKSLGVKGCSIWKVNGDTDQTTDRPNVDNVSIQLPSIELESTTINLMGSLDVPDISRIGNLQLTATIPVDNSAAMDLIELGKSVKWHIRWVTMEYDSITSVTTPVSYKAIVSGFVTSIPNSEVNAGSEGTADVTMNLISYKKSDLTHNKVIFDIDRGQGVFKFNGKDMISNISSLY